MNVLRNLWDVFNTAHQWVVGGTAVSFMAGLVLLHILLGIATLGLGDRTVCELLRPIRRIFKPEVASIAEGTLDVAIALPRAMLYYGGLYLRAYLLALRICFLLLVALVPALLVTLGLMFVAGAVVGFATPMDRYPGLSDLIYLSTLAGWGYFYWRIDGRRLVYNIRRSFGCR